MSDYPQSETIRAHNEQSLKKLAWALEASQGKFKLIFAHCNYINLRSDFVRRLQERLSFPIRSLTLQASETKPREIFPSAKRDRICSERLPLFTT